MLRARPRARPLIVNPAPRPVERGRGLFAAAPELLAELKAARDIVAEAFEYSDYMAATLGRGHSFTDIYGRAELAILRGIEAAIAKADA